MLHRIALAGLVAAALAGPMFAQTTGTLFADSSFENWDLVLPPSGPGVELLRIDEGAPYLSVRHRHERLLFSALTSYQAAPTAVYDPAELGAVVSFAISGRFRAQFEGAAPSYYSGRALNVYAVIVQGGTVYRSNLALFSWYAAVPLGVWFPAAQGALRASDFAAFPGGGRPDFSAQGGPMTIGLAVESGFQSSSEQPFVHQFAIDLDDFRVDYRLPGGSSPLAIYFASAGPELPTERGPIPYRSVQAEVLATLVSSDVRLSQAASEPVPFEVGFVGEPAISGVVNTGQTKGDVPHYFSRAYYAKVLELLSADGATIAEPRALAYLVSDVKAGCSFSALATWREDLRRFGYALTEEGSVPTAAPPGADSGTGVVQALRGLVRSAAGDIATLQALRDDVMAATAAGRYYAALYQTLSPAIVEAMVGSPALLVDLFSSADPWIDALETLVTGNGSAVVTAEMAADLNRLFDGFEANGSPALRRTLARERSRLGLDGLAGLTLAQFWQRVNDRWAPEGCAADGDGLCLGGGGRYRVEADWKTPSGAAGRGRAVPLSGDSGYFWFFDSANVEILTKVVDGCGLNQRIWSYSAGLTNLEVDLFVFDTATGRGRTYRNPQATNFAPILDSSYLECEAESAAAAATEPPSPSPLPTVLPLGGAGCTPGPETLCLDGGRFRVEADYRTAAGASGAARAVPLTDDTGTFWFFNAGNIELVVKTIDACGLAGFENYWVFAGGTTDVEVTLNVTDTQHDVTKTYRRPLGVPFAPVLDSGAFATCP
jgi:hypothetical protein